MQEQIKQWLEQGHIDIFLGYKMIQGHPLPYCFTKDNPDDLNDLIVGA
jgi:formate dehydrogenase subunit beta